MTFGLLRKAVLLSLRRGRAFRPWGEIEEYGRKNATYCDYDGAIRQGRGDLLSLWRLGRLLECKPQWVRYDATRRGYHVVARWDRNLDPAVIVGMQALLGSDQNRESFNLARLMSAGQTSGDGKSQKKEQAKAARWNILYRRKLTR
jgi:hypothetical protein